MAVTTISDLVIVPEKMSQYIAEKAIEKNTMINSGIASTDAKVEEAINRTPEGGRFIEIPIWNPLSGDDDVFGEDDLSVGNITAKASHATLLMRGKAWGATDLSRVLGGADPMAAIGDMIADWRNTKEQNIYLAILKGILSADGALSEHINDISAMDASAISQSATLDTKQLLGDHYSTLGMVFMHSATYTYLQKNDMISRTPVFNPAGDTVEIQTYLGYSINVDDTMPVDSGVYDTYFLGKDAFIRQEGTPDGFIGVETDRDALGAKDYLITRWCQIIHPRGLSWNVDATYPDGQYFPDNDMLATAENWTLAVDPKNVPIACLRHTL